MAQDLGHTGRPSRAASLVRVVWTHRATRSLENLFDYTEQYSPLAAQRLGLRLLGAAESLAEFPLRGRERAGGERELVIVQPYLLRYRFSGGRVFITDVRHGARFR